MTTRELADTILESCGSITCNCVPYAVDGTKPVHLPPLQHLDVFDYGDPWGDLSKEFTNRGCRINIQQIFDIIVVNGKPEAIRQHHHHWQEMLKPCGKLYVIFRSGERDKTFWDYRDHGFALIGEKVVEGKLHCIFRPKRIFYEPVWDGETNCRVLVHSTGGFGDDFAGARYVKVMKTKDVQVYFEARAELVRLFRKATLYDQIIPKGTRLPEFDYQISLSQLAERFGPYPAETPYLFPEVKADLALQGKVKVGFVHRGHTVKYGAKRSYDPQQFLRFNRIPGVVLYCLQLNDDSGVGIAMPEGDWYDTASLVAHMDYVLTPDTSMAHLAAAMGKPTLVFASTEHHNAYTSVNNNNSPFYPNNMMVFWGERAVDDIFDHLSRKIMLV